MKNLKLLIISILFTTFLHAQDQSGKFFVETGVDLFGYMPEFIGKSGIYFGKSKHIDLDRVKAYDYGDHRFSWAVSPRFGYHLNEVFMTGIDCQVFNYSDKDDDNKGWSYKNYSAGLFLRIDISRKHKIIPYIEFASGLGKKKEVWDATSPGGAEYQSSSQHNLFYLSGTPGLAYRLSKRFRINFMVRFQETIEKEAKEPGNGPGYETDNYEVGPMISLQYTFISKSKKSNQE